MISDRFDSFLFLIQTVKCLLIVPNPESALNEEAGKLLLEQYDDYFQRAKMMTEIHAKVSQAQVKNVRSCRTSAELLGFVSNVNKIDKPLKNNSNLLFRMTVKGILIRYSQTWITIKYILVILMCVPMQDIDIYLN